MRAADDESAAQPGVAEPPRVLELSDASDETRNYGQTGRELLLRPEGDVVLGRGVRRCWPTARFVRFLQLEAG